MSYHRDYRTSICEFAKKGASSDVEIDAYGTRRDGPLRSMERKK